MNPPHDYNFDVHGDGKVTEAEILMKKEMLEIERIDEKAEAQKRMAWTCILSMIVFTIALMTPLLSDNRVNAMADLFGLFYVAQASVVGCYFGAQAFMSRK